MKSSRVGNKGKRYVHYERFAVSVSHAIGWYEGVLGGCLIFPSDADASEPAQKIDLHGGPFVQEPQWPGLVASNDLVFAPDWMHGSNAHFLCAMVRRFSLAGANPAQQLRLRLVAAMAVYGGNDMD